MKTKNQKPKQIVKLNENGDFILSLQMWEKTEFSNGVLKRFEEMFSRFYIWETSTGDKSALWPANRTDEFYKTFQKFFDSFDNISFSLYIGIPYEHNFTICYIVPQGMAKLMDQHDPEFLSFLPKLLDGFNPTSKYSSKASQQMGSIKVPELNNN